jgi:hypothetical protein
MTLGFLARVGAPRAAGSGLAGFRLAETTRRTLAHLAPVVLTDEVEQLGLTDATIDQMELMLRSFPRVVRAGLIAGLTAFELGALAAPPWRARPFSRLPRARQEEYFRRWWESTLPPTRQFAKAVKGVLAFAYYELPEVRERVAYRPEPWIAGVKARRLRVFAEEVAAHDRLVLQPDPLVPLGAPPREPKRERIAEEVDHGAP